MSELAWSPQQENALADVAAWLRSGASQQVFRLFGYAGTGKTTLAKHFAGDVRGPVQFAAFTGKAASVMRRKGCDGASTIHSLIYRPEEVDGETLWRINPESPIAEADLIIIDECSMVGEELGRDLLSFGRSILVLGDPAQLPPVKGAGFFTDAEPDILLTEIHRQALENPIVRMSIDVREGRRLDLGDFGQARVIARSDVDPEEVLSAGIVLCGMNKTRQAFNRRMRALRGIESAMPVEGERLVCLKNDRNAGLLNGTLWTVDAKPKQRGDIIKLKVVPEEDGRPAHISVNQAFFAGSEDKLERDVRRKSQEMTFGYALTVHKSQGSQWDHVVLFDESGVFRGDARRHLYTGLTRAAERLTIVRAA